MPIIKSAKKRVRTAAKAAARNNRTKRTVKETLRALHQAVTGKKNSAAAHTKAQSAIDTAVKKGVMHKNKAARKQRQLAKVSKPAVGVKKAAAPKKTVAKKAVVAKKAAPAKKAPVKKAPVKKTVAKKPAVKKTVAKTAKAKK
jgi:ribosomal protein S20